MMKIITTFIIGFFECFNSKSLELFDYKNRLLDSKQFYFIFDL